MPRTPARSQSSPGHTKPATDAAKLEALFASIGEGIIATDERGIITRANQVALGTLGLRKSELIGQRFPEVVVALYENGQPMSIFERPITRSFMTGRAISERGIYRHKQGKHIPVYMTVSPIMLHGRPAGAIEVFRDLSEEIEQEKLKSDFISIASHQLRTPLSAIHMYTRMLQEGLGGKLAPQQQSYTDIVLSSVERMNELIDTLLNITRIEAGNLLLKSQPVQVDALLTMIVSEFMPMARNKNIKMTAVIDDGLPVLQSDPLLLKEVCANLLSNAIKYTPEQGEVTVALKRQQSSIVCSVRDNGYGIPKENQKYIFTKFFRADNIATKDVSGTGLGLYLAKLIVEKLGGELWFESKEGKGTTFSFSLPLSAL